MKSVKKCAKVNYIYILYTDFNNVFLYVYNASCDYISTEKDVIDNKNTDVTDCDSTTGGCDKGVIIHYYNTRIYYIIILDMAPTSSTIGKPVSAVIAISCSVGGIALVAVVIATAYVIRKRKQDHHHQK